MNARRNARVEQAQHEQPGEITADMSLPGDGPTGPRRAEPERTQSVDAEPDDGGGDQRFCCGPFSCTFLSFVPSPSPSSVRR